MLPLRNESTSCLQLFRKLIISNLITYTNSFMSEYVPLIAFFINNKVISVLPLKKTSRNRNRRMQQRFCDLVWQFIYLSIVDRWSFCLMHLPWNKAGQCFHENSHSITNHICICKLSTQFWKFRWSTIQISFPSCITKLNTTDIRLLMEYSIL